MLCVSTPAIYLDDGLLGHTEKRRLLLGINKTKLCPLQISLVAEMIMYQRGVVEDQSSAWGDVVECCQVENVD